MNLKTNLFSRLARIRTNQQGFTLTEMLIVLALIVLIAGFVGTQVFSRYEKAKFDSTKVQMRQLGTVLDQFRLDCGFYPSTEQGLKALLEKPIDGRECKNYDPEGYLKAKNVPKDGFNNEFTYQAGGSSYELLSLGRDGKEGGQGLDADLTSKELD